MSYAIGNIVYGISLRDLYNDTTENSPLDKFIPEGYIMDEFFTDEEVCTIQYSGNGDAPCYLGVDVGEIDEIDDIMMDDLPRSPTPEQQKEFADKLTLAIQRYPELKDALESAEPKLFITWGSS